MPSKDWYGMTQTFRRFLQDQSGATAIEYSLIAGLVSIVIIVAVTSIGTKLNVKLNNVKTALINPHRSDEGD